MQSQVDRGSIDKLLEIMAALRNPVGGCPWDLEQTFATIAPYTIEEAYEVADAIERGALDDLAGELGDLLFQVVFHARMAAEAGAFTFADVVERICTKMRKRHPHVFGEAEIDSAAQQTHAWEAIKAAERAAKAAGVLADVPVALPGMTRAVKLGRRAASVGFDWPDVVGVRAKLDEELGELDAALASEDRAAIRAELGDVLFSIANLCRHLGVDPESCIRDANERFSMRFGRVERAVESSGRGWREHNLLALEALWQRAKAEDRNP